MEDDVVCVCRVYLIEGSYPELLIQLWDSYATTGQSLNDRPGVVIESICIWRNANGATVKIII